MTTIKTTTPTATTTSAPTTATPASTTGDTATRASVDPHAPIAIVGLGGLFPGSTSMAQFWGHILAKSDLITDVPATHWAVSDYYDADPKKPDKTYAKVGGFLPAVDFDPLGFGIPPSLLSSTDTSQLLALLVARTTLEDAFRGQFQSADKSRISCILGVTSGQELFGQMASRLRRPEWESGLRAAGLDEETVQRACDKIADAFVPWTESTFPGLLGNVVAGRIANRLDLGGTNAVTDAACASSFAAIAMAVDELRLGRADVVLTGGVDTLNDIFMYMCFSKTPALSANGRIRPFDADADGTLLGEGLGMFALKRLDAAERDGDAVYAVIRGIGTSSDGRSKSVYAPVSEGQAKALTRAYESAGYSPRTVELVEAHGTGTKAGDVAEMGGLRLAFQGDDVVSAPWCAVGSVKSQIGHTKAAAGAAGLAKVALALSEGILPPTLNVSTPNPKLGLDDGPFYVSTEARPWLRGPEHPRRAGVSSFGFGGSNWHITLEEYRGAHRAARLTPRPGELLLVGAASRDALVSALSTVEARLDGGAALLDVARELAAAARGAVAHARVALVARDVADAKVQLGKARDVVTGAKSAPGIFFGEGAQDGKVAFLFSGQGSQYVEMGKELAMHLDRARDALDGALALPVADGRALRDVVFPPPRFDDAARARDEERLRATEHAQPALGALEACLLDVLGACGVRPDMVGGHSFGELTALYAAGVYDVDTLLTLARRRGELMAGASDVPGAMAAVPMARDELTRFLDDGGHREVVIANENAPRQTVVAGPRAAVDEAIAALEKNGVRATRLPVSTAFHSPLVAGARDAFAAVLDGVTLRAPAVPVFANTTAATYPPEPAAMRALLGGQLAAPVRFVDEVKAMWDAGARTFVEVGPSTVLSGLVGRILGDAPHVAIATDARGKDGVLALFAALGQLFARGVNVDLAPVFARLAPASTSLEAKKPALVVPLTGANVGKPEPVRQTNPPAPRAAPAAPPAPAAAIVAPSSSTPSALPPARPAQATPAPKVTPAMSQPKPASLPAASARPNTVSSSWLDVLREGQRGTAEAHMTFQRSLADAHTAFLAAYERSTRDLVAALGGDAATTLPVDATAHAAPLAPPAVVAAPVVAAPVVAAPVVAAPAPSHPTAAAPAAGVDVKGVFLDVVAEKTGYPKDALHDDMSLEADLGIDSIKRVEILSAIKARVPALPDVDALTLAKLNTLGAVAKALMPTGATTMARVAPAPATVAAAAPSVDVKGAFLDVVAEKTGYPKDALHDDMSLEADLGIDSIKRVEILSAIKARVPALPDVDALTLAKLNTLGAVAKALIPTGATTTMTAARAAPAPVLARAPAVDPSIDVKSVFLDVVAEKTGYPKDALHDDMSLEADLGIDSIKRVEILSAIKARVPALPDVDALTLAKLNTLGAVAQALMPTGTTTTASAAPAGAPASAPAVDAAVDVKSAFLDVVAEKTGYPKDALHDDMSLEADLGIDSIKRVEILSAIKGRVPALPDVDALTLAKLNTLGAVAQALMPRGPVTAPASVDVTGAATPVATAARAPCALVGLVDAPLTARRPLPAIPGRTIGVFGADDARVAAVVDALVRAGAPAEALPAAGLNGHSGRLFALVLVDGATPFADAGAARARLTANLLALKDALPGISSHAGKGFVLALTPGGGDFGATTLALAHAPLFGLAGLVKTAALEIEGLAARVLDVDPTLAPDALAALVVDELADASAPLEVGRAGDARRARALAPRADVVVDAGGLSRPVTVATGGARGVTAECLIAWAKETRPRLAILARSPRTPDVAPAVLRAPEAGLLKALLDDAQARGVALSPKDARRQADLVLAAREVERNVARLEAAGAEVLYVEADVSARASVGRALDEVRARFGPIEVLVHGAGVLADRMIADKSAAEVERVLATKVDGLLHLLDATAADPLARVALFSSVAGRFGNKGQSDYAMANEAVTAIGQALKGRGVVVKSFAWGPWEGGMVTPALRRHFAAMGVEVIGYDDGAGRFAEELSSGASNATEIVVGGPITVPAAVSAHAVKIDRARLPFLVDHSVKGRPVLPAAFAVDLMVDAALRAFPGQRVRAVADVKVLRGIRLAHFDNGGDTLDVRVTRDDGVVRAELAVPGEKVARYRATLELAPRLDVAPAPLALSGAGRDVPTSALYDGGPLFHGAQFRLLERVTTTPDGFVAWARALPSTGWGAAFSVDTAAIDAALQLALVNADRAIGGQFLPTGIARVRFFVDALPAKVALVLRPLTATPDRVTADVVVTDERGQPLLALDGVEVHRVPAVEAPGPQAVA